jgi:hypothetical protein
VFVQEEKRHRKIINLFIEFSEKNENIPCFNSKLVEFNLSPPIDNINPRPP